MIQGLEYLWIVTKWKVVELYFVAVVWLRDFWKKTKEE